MKNKGRRGREIARQQGLQWAEQIERQMEGRQTVGQADIKADSKQKN